MTQKPYSPVLLLAVVLSLFLGGCPAEDNKTNATYGRAGGGMAAEMAVSADMGRVASSPKMASFAADSAPPSAMVMDRDNFKDRRIAENHNMTVRIRPDSIKSRFDRDLQGCLARGCEILNANSDSYGYGNIAARIAPDKLGDYLDFIATGEGTLRAHNVYTDDQTMQYIDTESRLKTQEALRDRLLKLLDSNAAKVEDIIKIEQELSRVQGEIDSMNNTIRHLQKITDNATVSVQYEPSFPKIEVDYDALANSWRNAWQNFIQNVAAVVSFIGGIIPWLPIWFVGLWVFVKMFRFAFGKGRLQKLLFRKSDGVVAEKSNIAAKPDKAKKIEAKPNPKAKPKAN